MIQFRKYRPQYVFAVLSALALGMVSPAWATPTDPCVTQKNTLEINECLSSTYRSEDKILNQTYQALLKNMRALAKEAGGAQNGYKEAIPILAEAQKSWVRFKDRDCSAKYAVYIEGSIRNAVYLQCLINHTKARNAELEDWLKL